MTIALVTIAPGHALTAPAAAAWARAVAAGCPVAITSSYRTPEHQARLRVAYLANPTKVAYAAPVNASEHVTGNALDLKPPASTWMRAHPGYGFVFTDPRESWHVAYRVAADRHLFDTPPPAPIDPTEDDDMSKWFPGFIVTRPGTTAQFLLSPDLTTKRHLHTIGEVELLRTVGAIENPSITADTIDAAVWEPCHNVWES